MIYIMQKCKKKKILGFSLGFISSQLEQKHWHALACITTHVPILAESAVDLTLNGKPQTQPQKKMGKRERERERPCMGSMTFYPNPKEEKKKKRSVSLWQCRRAKPAGKERSLFNLRGNVERVAATASFDECWPPSSSEGRSYLRSKA